MVSTNDELQTTVPAGDVQVAETAEIKTISEEDFIKAQKSFQQGKKNLVLNKYAESVNNIEEACRVYSAKFGEFDPQCAEVYFYFGKALLELARVENNVLGNALAGVPEDTGPIDDSRYGNPDEIAPEEKEQISDKVIDAMCEPETKPTEETTENGTTTETKPTTTETTEPTEATKKDEEKPTTAETTTETTTETAKTEDKPTEGETEKKEEGGEAEADEDEEEDEDEETAEEGGEGEGKESADEISNLQRAWEMFELAKLVYTKHTDEEPAAKKKRIAECLLKLGEIGIEQELYEQACGDIKECIRLQEEQRDDERDERFLAESYYQLGLAQQFANLFEEARESFQRALNILQLRTDKLKGRLQTAATLDDDEKTKLGDEIAEIEALLPDLNTKLEELNEQDKQAMAAIQEAKECFINSVNNGGTAALNPAAVNADEVKDITSMVKSKRKISNGAAEDVGGLKKTRLSAEHSNGNVTTTTTTDEATPMNDETTTTTTTTATTTGETPAAENGASVEAT